MSLEILWLWFVLLGFLNLGDGSLSRELDVLAQLSDEFCSLLLADMRSQLEVGRLKQVYSQLVGRAWACWTLLAECLLFGDFKAISNKRRSVFETQEFVSELSRKYIAC